VNFDAPDRSACVVKRARSNTPLQALTLMNDQAYVELAAAFATRIMREAPEASVEGRITFGLRLCVARAPKTAELEPLVKLYQEELARYRADPAAAAKLVKSWKLPQLTENHDQAELAAWFCVASVLLNLDETITKG
jgi:hypothetical protein